MDYHSDTHTHIDALSHVGYEGSLYNGRPAAAVTSRGAAAESIEVLKDGLVGRGVLLDIPASEAFRGSSPASTSSPTSSSQRSASRSLGSRRGHPPGPNRPRPPAEASSDRGTRQTPSRDSIRRPRPSSRSWDRAALGTDITNADTAPSSTARGRLSDPRARDRGDRCAFTCWTHLRLEDLLAACAHARRWEFLFVAAPLRITGGTGSPANARSRFSDPWSALPARP